VPNDAKLGMAVGLSLVIVVAVLFFRKDGPANTSAAGPRAVTPSVPRNRPPARPLRQAGARRHIVADGETLFSLARRYYGDGERFVDLYRANRRVLPSPDRLAPGTELVIPDLPAPPDD
jgi:nucleoid-associated protein YgaU